MKTACKTLSVLLILFGCGFCLSLDQTSTAWSSVSTPFRPFNVTAAGTTLWVCGTDEMVESSSDGGLTWELRHQNRGGELLLNIAFIDEKVGHAAGTGGLLLSTIDGGQTWKSYRLNDTVRSFSFADEGNGLAVVSDHVSQPTDGPATQVQGTAAIDGTVKITHDGGEHWEDIEALKSSELRVYTQVLSVAALDKSHYLMIRRQPGVEDAFVVTKDGGKSWKLIHMQNDATNRVLAWAVFVHQGEFWAFGHELVHREKGGGYGAPLTLHSKDGENWVHGVRGPDEFNICNSQGCYLWDGVVEELYGEHEKIWALPQDKSLTEKWAIVGNKICSVGSALKCAVATATDKPQPRAEEVVVVNIGRSTFAEGCLDCSFEPIAPDEPGVSGRIQLEVSLRVGRDGSVATVSVDHAPSKRIKDAIVDQLATWLFEPAHKGIETAEVKKEVSLYLMCFGFAGRPETNRCTLHSPEEFSALIAPAPIAQSTVNQ